MHILEQYDEVAEDARVLLGEMFSKAYKKREGRRILGHAGAGAAIGAGVGALAGGIGAVPGAAVGTLAGTTVGKFRAHQKRVRHVARFAREKGAKFG